jgi:acetyl esterase/lipase
MPSPQLQTIIQILRSGPNPADLTIDEQRTMMETIAAQFKPAEDVRSEPVDTDGIPAEWITTPGADADRVIYFLHGGGYVMGSIDTHREMISRISRASAARALAPLDSSSPATPPAAASPSPPSSPSATPATRYRRRPCASRPEWTGR